MLYLMRHGQTEWNRQKMLQGRSDIPLNENGRQMAMDAAVRYQDTHLDLCFCSPLLRAAETAKLLLAGRDVPIIPDSRLVEMCFGSFEGTTGFYEPAHPLYTLFRDPGNYVSIEGSESFDSVYARTGEFLSEKIVPLLQAGKDIVIVGHGGMCLSISNRIRHVTQPHYWDQLMRNCELMAFGNEEVLSALLSQGS